MKKILVLMVFALISISTMAQDNYRDVVYLKNGSVLRGIITEQHPNVSIKLETADLNIFVFRMEEIEKIAKEPYIQKREPKRPNSGIESGYVGTLELGYQVGLGTYGMDRLKLNIINGYQLNPYVALGIGTGMRYYPDAEAVLVPFFANARVNFMDNQITPYASLDIGYSLDATNGFEGVGLMMNPTIGVSFKVSDKSFLNVGLGYEMQKMEFLYLYSNGGYYTTSENSGALNIHVGIVF